MAVRESPVSWNPDLTRVEFLDDEQKPLCDVRYAPKNRVKAFETALRRGEVPDWSFVLTGLALPERVELLNRLAEVELRHRWKHGERPMVEDYHRQFPELGPAATAREALILQEFRCRRDAGEYVRAEEYRDRFPSRYSAIRTQLEVGAPTGSFRPGPIGASAAGDGAVTVRESYDLVRELGRGKFGVVWLARKRPCGIEKAIKILQLAGECGTAQREWRSLELIKNVRHPFLIATEDFWIANEQLHIVMELADGTLRERLVYHQSRGRTGIPPGELVRYTTEAAEGLDHLHTYGIVHRDVKPDNILILHNHAKVADLGLARTLTIPGAESQSVAGTPAYMAPETWAGASDAQSDLYSLAVTYVYARQGRSPLRPGALPELRVAHEEGLFDFADVIGAVERCVLLRALASRPGDRYPTCRALAEELARAVGTTAANG